MSKIKSHFLFHLKLDPLPDGRNWKLLAHFGFWSSATGMVNIPKGFVTDLASVPRLFWNIFPPFGKYIDAAVIHDYLYQTQTMPRSVADGALMEGMKLCNVNWMTRQTIYRFVRIGGWKAWSDNKKKGLLK